MIAAPYTPSLRESLAETRKFGTMVILLDEVGLGGALDRPGYAAMLLAVPDQVFTRLRSGVLAHLRADRPRLGAMLARHVIRGSFQIANEPPRFARGSSAGILDTRPVNPRQPLRAAWWLDAPDPCAVAGMGEAFPLMTFGGPIEVRVRPGAVMAGGVEVQLPSFKTGLWYEVDHLIGGA